MLVCERSVWYNFIVEVTLAHDRQHMPCICVELALLHSDKSKTAVEGTHTANKISTLAFPIIDFVLYCIRKECAIEETNMMRRDFGIGYV